VSLLDLVVVIAGLMALVAAPFSLIGWSNSLSDPKGEHPSLLKRTLFFAIPLLVATLAVCFSTLIAQCQVAQFLGSVSDRYTISIDGHVVQNQDQLLATLKEFADLPAHHSQPTREFQVKISDPPKSMRLRLGRDSDDPHEYWVFAPSPSKLAARVGMKKDIGHIKTTVFDAYQ
jgi:hypothetical protein